MQFKASKRLFSTIITIEPSFQLGYVFYFSRIEYNYYFPNWFTCAPALLRIFTKIPANVCRIAAVEVFTGKGYVEEVVSVIIVIQG